MNRVFQPRSNFLYVVTAIIVSLLFAVVGYASLAIAGCNNVPMTQNTPVVYNVSFLQNQWIWDTNSFLYNYRLNTVSQQMAGVTSAPYDVPIPNQINIHANNLMPASEPQEITDCYAQNLWMSKLCRDYDATRVGTPYTLMLFNCQLGTWNYSFGYTYRCYNDYTFGIMLPRQNPWIWPPHAFLHELGHSVGLRHMTVQSQNIMVGGGSHWINGDNPCHPMGWAMDSVQAYYVQSEPCFSFQGMPDGAFYPHWDNHIYGIPTPVPWCP